GVACRVVSKHGDRVAPFHHLARQALKASGMPLGVDLVPRDLEEAGIERRAAEDSCFELALAHGGSLRWPVFSPSVRAGRRRVRRQWIPMMPSGGSMHGPRR